MKETIAFEIAALHRDFLAYTTEILKKYELGFGQIPFIVYVGKYPNTTQAALTRSLKVDWGYSQRSIKRLVELGLMRKEFSSPIGCHCLNLTDRGKEIFVTCHDVFTTWDSKKTDGLTPDEKEILKTLLQKMLGAHEES